MGKAFGPYALLSNRQSFPYKLRKTKKSVKPKS